MQACLYFSAAVGVDGPLALRERLAELSGVSQPNNRRDALTGVLIGSGDAFLQYVEGPRVSLAALMERIYADPRHDRIVIAQAMEIETRTFANWAMTPIQAEAESAHGFTYRTLCEEPAGRLMRRIAHVAAHSEKSHSGDIEIGADVVRL